MRPMNQGTKTRISLIIWIVTPIAIGGLIREEASSKVCVNMSEQATTLLTEKRNTIVKPEEKYTDRNETLFFKQA